MLDRLLKVELEGVSYTDFVVPECPQCLLESKRNSVVRGSVISMFSGSLISVAQTRANILW